MKQLFKGIALGAALLSAQPVLAADRELLNTSYDIARELFAAYNEEFKKHWQEKTGETVEIKQSHAGSSKQAQAIIQGLKADVATFNQVTDIDILHQRGRLIPEDWADRLPNNSSPYYSTMAFLVREGNPKNIENWDDLVREDVQLVMPNPKTSETAVTPTLPLWATPRTSLATIRKKLISSWRTCSVRYAFLTAAVVVPPPHSLSAALAMSC